MGLLCGPTIQKLSMSYSTHQNWYAPTPKSTKGDQSEVPVRIVRYMSRAEVKDLVFECIENFDKRGQNDSEGVSFAKMCNLI